MTKTQRAVIEGLLTFMILSMVAGAVLAFVGWTPAGIALIGFGTAGILSLFVAQWRLQRPSVEESSYST